MIGFVLGDVIERNFYTALQSSLGNYDVFVASPVAATLAAMTALAAVFCAVKVVRGKRDQTDSAAFSTGGLAFAALLLTGSVFLLWQAMAPGWRGGIVAPAVLTMAAVLLVVVLADTWRGHSGAKVPEVGATLRLTLLLGVALIAALWLGFLVGMATFLLVFWTGVQRRSLSGTLLLTLLFAVALPVGFAWLVAAPLWRGVTAPLWNGIVGGEVIPAL